MLTDNDVKSSIVIAETVSDVVKQIVPYSGDAHNNVLQSAAQARGLHRVDQEHDRAFSIYD